MAGRLIVNADDFGLTHGINRAVGELHDAGALKSATLMANGAAFEDAVEVARARPELGVGCHIVLTDGVPVSHPNNVRTLLGQDGRSFRPSVVDFIRAALLGQISAEEVAREGLAQIERLERAGIKVTHIDTHKHAHVWPSIARPLLEAAERAGVHAVRNPFEPAWSLALKQGSGVRRMAVRAMGLLRGRFQAHAQIRQGRVRTTDGTIAISATGELNAETLKEVLRAMPAAGTFELCCHPGYNDGDLESVTTRLRRERDVEREALLAEVPRALRGGGAPQLTHYGELGSSSPA
jgi:predicted glycoside hydrolase/deacetylase ChbG (UPF0249 family)